MNNNVFFQQFCDYIEKEKRYSIHTLTSYQNDLSQFFQFLQKHFDEDNILNVKTTFVRTWLANLKENQYEAKTINRKISTLRAFYKFLLKQNLITQSPIQGIVALKTPKRLVDYIEQKDINALLEEVVFEEGFKGVLDKMIIEVFYATGLRVAELTFLKDKNIDIYNNTLKVLGKGNKERLIPLHATLMLKIKDYWKQRQNIIITHPQEERFFVLDNGNNIYVKYVYNIVKKYLTHVSTLTKKSPHVLRHTFATHLLQNGAEINAVKELLGHANLAATQIYTHHTIDKLKQIHKKLHPKG